MEEAIIWVYVINSKNMRKITTIYCIICCCITWTALILTFWLGKSKEAQAACLEWQFLRCTGNGCTVDCPNVLGVEWLLVNQALSGRTSGAYPIDIEVGLCYRIF